MIHWPNVVLKLGQRLRLCSSIKTKLIYCLLLAGFINDPPPANTTRWNSVVLMLGQRHRRLANIKTTLFHLVIAGHCGDKTTTCKPGETNVNLMLGHRRRQWAIGSTSQLTGKVSYAYYIHMVRLWSSWIYLSIIPFKKRWWEDYRHSGQKNRTLKFSKKCSNALWKLLFGAW